MAAGDKGGARREQGVTEVPVGSDFEWFVYPSQTIMQGKTGGGLCGAEESLCCSTSGQPAVSGSTRVKHLSRRG